MKKIVIAVIVAIVFVILLLVYTKANINAHVIDEGNVREIVIDTKQFEYNPNVIKVKEGEKIKLKINSLDVEHSINIPELGIMIHGEGVFVADKKGTFNFSCHTYCGIGHDAMKGVLIVE